MTSASSINFIQFLFLRKELARRVEKQSSICRDPLPPCFRLCFAWANCSLWSLISEWQLWLVYTPEMCFIFFRNIICCFFSPPSERCVQGSFVVCCERMIKLPALSCQVWSQDFVLCSLERYFYFIKFFSFFLPFVAVGNLHTSIPGEESNDNHFFSFLSPTSHVSASFSGTCRSDRHRDEKWKRAVD